MTRCSLLRPGLLCAVIFGGGLLLLAAPARAQTPIWLQNYRARIGQQWNKPAGERFANPRGRGTSRLFSRMGSSSGDKLRSVASRLGTPLGQGDDGMAALISKQTAQEQKRRAARLHLLRPDLRDHLSRHHSLVERLGTSTRGWASRYLSPWSVTGGFGGTVRRAAGDIHTRWEARLRLVHTPQPRLPLTPSKRSFQR